MSNFYVFENFGTQNQIFQIFSFASVINNVKTHILAKNYQKWLHQFKVIVKIVKISKKNGRKSKNYDKE